MANDNAKSNADKQGASSLQTDNMADLQARVAAMEAENVRLQKEIANRNKSESSLRDDETLYRTIAHFAYDWVYWEIPDGTLRYVSPSCERITGYTPDEFIANPHLIDDLVLPEDREILDNHHHKSDTTQKRQLQFRIQQKDGEIRWLEHICQPVTNSDGKFDGFRVSNRDISHRKEIEAALRQSEFLLSESQRIAHLGHWEWNVESNTLYWSDEIYRIFGLPPQQFDVTYDDFLNSVHPDDQEFVQQAVNAALNKEQTYSIDHRIVLPDGLERMVHEQGEVTFNKQGQPVRMLGTVQDITERKETESALLASRVRFANILDIALEAIISVDEEYKVMIFNKGAEQTFGYTADEVVGQPMEMLLPQRFRTRHPQHMKNFADGSVLARHISERGQIFGRRKNGEEFPAEASVSKLNIDDQTIFTIILRDITQRKEIENELHAHRDHLEDLVTVRTAELTRTNKVLQREISERTQAEERLKEQDYIISNSPVIVFSRQATEGWPVEYVSDNVREFGYTPQDFYTAQLRYTDIIHPDDVAQLKAEVKEYSRSDRSGFIQEYRFLTDEGEIRWVEDRTWIRRDENNVISHYQGIVFDITNRKAAELALQESEETSSALLNASIDSAMLLTVDGTVTAANELTQKRLGQLTGKEIVGEKIFNIFPEDVAERRRAYFDEAINSGHPVRFEDTRSGRWFDNHFYPVLNMQGQVDRVAVYARDITEYRQAVESLKESEEKFRNLAEQSPNMIFINQGGKIVYTNQICVDIMGYSRSEFLSPDFEFLNLIAPKDTEFIIENFKKHSRGEDVAPYEYGLITKEGQKIDAIITSKVMKYAGETAILGIVTDITTRKQHEITMQRVNRELEQHVEKLSTLNLIAQTVATVTDLETILGVVAGTVAHLFDAYGTDINLLDNTAANLTVYARIKRDEIPGQHERAVISLADDPVARQVIETGKSMVVHLAQTESVTEPIDAMMRAGNMHALMNVPMLARGNTTGLISIYSDQPVRKFTTAEIRLAETIAGQVAGAVETARLFGQEQSRRHEAERRRQIAESLGGILAVLNTNQPLEDTLDYIANQTNRLLKTDANAIYQYNKNDDSFVVLAAQGHYANEIKTMPTPLGHCALKQALLTGQPLALADMPALLADDIDSPNLALTAQSQLSNLAQQFQALLTVPLIIAEETYGGIILYYRNPPHFSAEEISLAVIFGSQVALAIENARLRFEAEKAAVVAERNRLARDLHDSVTQTLFSVAAIAEALPRVWESHPAEAYKALEDLRRLTQGALAEMRNLLLELRPAVLVEKPMSELLRQLADAMMGRTRMQVTTTVVDERELPPDTKIALYRIAQEALNNVTKHARAGQVKMGLYYESEKVELHISDNGVGFDPQTVTPDRLGVGIMIERTEAIGATFDIKSQPDQGTHIVVTWSDSEKEGQPL